MPARNQPALRGLEGHAVGREVIEAQAAPLGSGPASPPPPAASDNARVTQPRLRKGLGQHHLTDGRLCRPLLAALGREWAAASAPAGPSAGRTERAGRRAGEGPLRGARVLEIGPGGGVLTAELVAAGAEVLAVELDPAWAFALHHRLGVSPGGSGSTLHLAVADALALAWERLPAGTLVAGNLPYNVATALVSDALRRAPGVPAMAFLVQLEVAERLVARPGDAAYGALSVLVAIHAEVELVARVAPGSFRPPPKVWSAFVALRRRPPPLPAAELPGLERTVRLAFAQRRKTLRNNLVAACGKGAAAAVLADLERRLGWPADLRAEALDLAGFVELHRSVCNLAPTALD
jgi:16S rRNA (adenine1518-N6/adenine1519-N6)-dimethyltransferase